MTNFLFALSMFVMRVISPKEIEPDATNADYKLVIKDRKSQKCETRYFFTVREAIEYASPPNLFLGDGHDYFLYHRLAENKEQYVKLYNSKTNEVIMAKTCIRQEPKLTQFSNGFELRKLNRKICGEVTPKGNMLITFIRVLSKEEAAELKDMEPYPMSFMFKNKLLINRIAMSPETMSELLGVLDYVIDHLEEMKYHPESNTEVDE